MNANNFTQKTIETIQTAQSMAEENNNQYITPEHLLYALVDQDGGLIPSLLGKMGVDCNGLWRSWTPPYPACPRWAAPPPPRCICLPEADRVLKSAEKAAKSMGDEYLSVEH
jgi:ATP-dependent Clp protease ATP-binding subunit ClpB